MSGKKKAAAKKGSAPSTPTKEEKKETQPQTPTKEEKKEAPKKEETKEEAKEVKTSNNYGVLPLHQSKEKQGRTFSEIKDLDGSKADQTILIRARLEGSRLKGNKLCFLTLRQGAFSIQGVLFQSGDVTKDMIEFVSSISQESLIEVEGKLTKTKEAIESTSQKDVEIQVNKVHVFTYAISPLPLLIQDASRPESVLDKQDQEIAELEKQIGEVSKQLEAKETPELKKKLEELQKKKSEAAKFVKVGRTTRLDNRILDLRVQANNAIFRIQSAVTNLFRETLLQQGFMEIHSPKIIGTASEGGAQVFRLKYFGEPACMAQSPQLYKQMALSSDFDRVFEVGPVFRAEDANTHRHLTEFVGLDLEMAFYEHYHEVLDVIDRTFNYIFDGLNKRFAKELEIIQKQYPFEPLVYKYPSLRLTYPEVVKLLRDAGENIGDLDDLSTPQEKKLGKIIKEKYKTDFYFVDKFPLSVRPFYSMPDPENPNYANAYDFFLRGEEIMSGAQRIHEPEYLIERAKASNINPDSIKDYVNAFRYGMYPHAGGGIGLERVVMLFLGLSDIRQTSLFPRDPHRLTP